jgi:hypothetical protein
MKQIIMMALLMLAFTGIGRAQTETTPRVLIGGMGGSSFGNYFIGLTTAAEVPAGRHLEFDVKNTFSPLENHIGFGRGWAENLNGGGIVWLNESIGLDGAASYSRYNTTITKAGQYAFAGVVLRREIGDVPARFYFNYIREFNNGIFPNNIHGTESTRLQGGEFKMETRLQCNQSGNRCLRMTTDFQVGHVLTQSNPVCDGTFGKTGGPNGGPCYRTGQIAGAFTIGLALEMRHKADYRETF